MKPDIQNRADIEQLVNQFYDLVKQDTQIGPFFSDVIPVNWEKHLPIMYAFWENTMFHTGGFEGNPMQKHLAIHRTVPLTSDHFGRWLELFYQTVDALYEGENAETIKQRATSMATVMQIKMENDNHPPASPPS